jgi:hypothetical protein
MPFSATAAAAALLALAAPLQQRLAMEPAALELAPIAPATVGTPASEPAPPAAGAAAEPAIPAAEPATGSLESAEPPPPLPEEEFVAILERGDRDELATTCTLLIDAGDQARLRRLHERLVELHPSPQSYEVVVADAEALLGCAAPQAALTVLDRFGPAPGPRRQAWLELQWRAATAALDHRRAALALERLGGNRLAGLTGRDLPLRPRDDGTIPRRPALDLLADHLEARGFPQAAGEVLLAATLPGVEGAERLRRAAALLDSLPLEERAALLEAALEQAAAVGAWGLVTELLDQQLGFPSARERALERRLRLSDRLDDAYGEWRLRRQDPAAAGRAGELEQMLRSPRDPGGHAPPPPEPLP